MTPSFPRLPSVGCALAGLLSPAALAQDTPELEALGTLGGSGSQPYVMNNTGQICGRADTADGVGAPFFWDPIDRVMVNLAGDSGQGGSPYAINSLGQCAGQQGNIAAFWDPASGTSVAFSAAGTGGRVVDLNDAGQVAGNGVISGVNNAFFGDAADGSVVNIHPDGWTWSAVQSISSGGVVVGFGRLGDLSRVFVYEPDVGASQDIGDLGDGGTVGLYFANDAGQLAGFSTTADGDAHTFYWAPDSGGMVDVGDLGGGFSTPQAMNGTGQIVGRSPSASDPNTTFFWDPDVRVIEQIPNVDGMRLWPLAITSDGIVVGYDGNQADGYYLNYWDTVTDETWSTALEVGMSRFWVTGATEGANIGGTYLSGEDDFRGFYTGPEGPMVDIGSLGGDQTYVYRMNAIGDLAGFSETEPEGRWDWQAFYLASPFEDSTPPASDTAADHAADRSAVSEGIPASETGAANAADAAPISH